MKKHTVTINNKEYGLKVGFGVMMEFEEQFSKPISSIKTTKEIVNLIYITLIYNNEGFDFSFKDFTDNILDENPNLITAITEQLFGDSKTDENPKKK